MRAFFIAILLQCILCLSANTQPLKADSLYKLLRQTTIASKTYDIQSNLFEFYVEKNRDSALYFANNCIALAEKNNMLLDEAMSLADKGHALMHLERLPEAYTCFNTALEIAGDSKNNGKAWDAEASANPDQYRLK